MSDLLPLVPVALEIVKALTAGDAEKAAQKTKALGQAIAIKVATRAAAKSAAKALKR
jgi:hypothetical protein